MSGLFRAVILGPPASGKGTISSRIIKYFEMKHVSSGDILRTSILQKTGLGLEAKTFMDHGNLVPDEVMEKLIETELTNLGKENWLLDGYPRTQNQADALYKIHPVNMAINLQVPFEVIIDRIKGRWTHVPSGRIYHTEFNPPKVPWPLPPSCSKFQRGWCQWPLKLIEQRRKNSFADKGKDDKTGEDLVQREDDTPDAIRNRLEIYSETIGPVMEFYNKAGILKNFQGRESNEIWPLVYKCLSRHLKPKYEL